MKTQHTQLNQIKHSWHLVDVKNKTLGRAATQIAQLLMGKGKPYFVRNIDCGDHVVVINAKLVQVTGNKSTQKIYTQYSGYPGGLRKEAFKDLLARRPEEVIVRSVSGMIPHNKLHDKLMKRLLVYPEATHAHADKLAQK